jgi:hypothetical protein
MNVKNQMKWSKKGCIFSPDQFKNEFNGMVYAQSPQALPIENGVRVYFSTRSVDLSGKYLSHIAFAEFSRDFKVVRDISSQTVIPLGCLGDFDEHGIFPIHIFKNQDKIFGYTTGWNRRKSVSADASIGLGISIDGGRTFEKIGRGPVLTSSLHEPFLVGDPFVLLIGQVFHMWYISGKRWISSPEATQAERVYKISHAISDDGIHWKRDNLLIVPDSIGADECQALPSVCEVDGIYHMVFCYRDAIGFRTEAGKGYRLGYAYSKDLVHWTRNDQVLGLELTGEGWDGQMMCYPHLFRLDERIALLYNGNNFGKEGFGLAILESDINEHIKS